MMRLFLPILFLIIVFEGTCQTRCVDVIQRLDPDPYELLNDSITYIATAEEIEGLIKEQYLIFSYTFNLQTLEINKIKMDYFEAGLLNGEVPLSSELIKNIENLFKRNLKVIVNPEYTSSESENIVDCSFLSRIIPE
ncbi:hypothetical protein [Reichenbachiella ulvae]|uniref:Uncharacterized protein n=1 Tax=Reichenbachiella ulvae TaxID=2980104 RepID=A0ABT3CSN3_9BACT|nr:hypothetical protein [Reichenbachiella ulvae]MCV9386617.1 hypothetical protein [Reichenbachiella ulvae]